MVLMYGGKASLGAKESGAKLAALEKGSAGAT